jgi:hypothetical protein
MRLILSILMLAFAVTVHAGYIEHRDVNYYLDRAFNLGRKLV